MAQSEDDGSECILGGVATQPDLCQSFRDAVASVFAVRLQPEEKDMSRPLPISGACALCGLALDVLASEAIRSHSRTHPAHFLPCPRCVDSTVWLDSADDFFGLEAESETTTQGTHDQK